MSELRLAEGYVPTFDIDAEVGRQGELLTLDVIASLKNGASVEVKTDERFIDTGNVFFEYACWRLGRWCASGIAATHAEIWVHVLASNVPLVLNVPVLKRTCDRLRRAGYKKSCQRGSHPTWGACAKLLVFLAFYREAEAELNGIEEDAA